MEPNDVQDTDSWSESPGFWYRHPLLAWSIQLAMFVPLFIFLAPYLLGSWENRMVTRVLGVVVGFALAGLTRGKRSLRPSPFFFWF